MSLISALSFSSLSSRPFLVGTNLSPTTSALGSSVSSTGSNLSALQFDSGVMLTSGTVQQVATAVTPLLNPAVIGVIELGSSLGSQLGVGAPLDQSRHAGRRCRCRCRIECRFGLVVTRDSGRRYPRLLPPASLWLPLGASCMTDSRPMPRQGPRRSMS